MTVVGATTGVADEAGRSGAVVRVARAGTNTSGARLRLAQEQAMRAIASTSADDCKRLQIATSTPRRRVVSSDDPAVTVWSTVTARKPPGRAAADKPPVLVIALRGDLSVQPRATSGISERLSPRSAASSRAE
jgi:hypothetical protein